MDKLTTIIAAILSSSVLSALINGILAWARDKKEKETGATAGVRMLLYDRIKHRGRVYIAKGSISAEDLEDLIEMHKIYHDKLNGNGFLDTIMSQVRALPIINERR